MPQWTVTGAFRARRAFWQSFRRTCEAASAEAARETVLSFLGGCHHVGRALIRIDSVAEAGT
jgi:ribosomal protein L20A (L18A)